MSREPASLSVRLSQPGPIPLAVDFACGPGELLALVGPSGAGKTTVLCAVAGLYRPGAGRIVCGSDTWFDGAAPVMVPPQARAVGLVFQDYALFPHLSALDNVRLAMHHIAEPARTAAAQSLLQRVHLDGFEARTPDRLSGGQRQRVALARALARDPKVLLLDEPFSAVDRMTRESLKEELASLRRSLAIPIILVTHDLEEAQALADRISVIDRGRTLQTGTPDDVRLRPASGVVARLTGQTNIFAGVVERVSSEGKPGRIRWDGHSLDVSDTGAAKVGQRVTWLVPPDYVALADAAADGEGNVATGMLVEIVRLGERCVLAVQLGAGERLRFTMAARDLGGRGLQIRSALSLRLLPEGIHLMPSAR